MVGVGQSYTPVIFAGSMRVTPFQGLAPDNQHVVTSRHIFWVSEKDHGLGGPATHHGLLLSGPQLSWLPLMQ